MPTAAWCRGRPRGRTQTYTYDRYGNQVSKTTDGSRSDFPADGATNRMNGATYDGAGRLRSYPGLGTYTFDSLDTLTASTVGAGPAVYVYNAGDERIVTYQVDAYGRELSSEWTLRDASGAVLRRFLKSADGKWSWEEDYIYLDGRMLAAETAGPHRTLHFHLDHLGTPRLITNHTGAVVSEHAYFPFGEEATSTTQHSEKTKFTGHERDSAGQDYMHARYYTGYWGRFVSVDPVLDQKAALKSPQMWNRYAYVRNNPINAVDPTGRREAMVYGQVRDVEPGDVVLLRSKATGRIVHIAVIGHFKSVKGQKLPNALVWENAPAKGDKNNSRGRIADSSPHQPSLVDSNSTAAGGVAGWNLKNMDLAGTFANRDLLGAGPRSVALRPFACSEVARAALAVGPVTYNNQWAGASGPICDCAGFANQLLNNLGGTLTGRTFLTGDGLTINEWADATD